MRLKKGFEKVECALLPAQKAKLKAYAALQNLTLQDCLAGILGDVIKNLKLEENK